MTLINDLVKQDLDQRLEFGVAKYGNPLTVELPPHNGMKPLQNSYEECLDMAVYLRKEMADREGIEEVIRQANLVIANRDLYSDDGLDDLAQALINAGVRNV